MEWGWFASSFLWLLMTHCFEHPRNVKEEYDTDDPSVE